MDAPIFLHCQTNSLRRCLTSSFSLGLQRHYTSEDKEVPEHRQNIGETMDEFDIYVELRSYNKTIILSTALNAAGLAPGRLRLH